MAAWFVIQAVVPGAHDTGDRELLGDLASGSADALAELYDRHAASLYRHALALTRHVADAEDLVHAVFVKLATTGAELLVLERVADRRRGRRRRRDRDRITRGTTDRTAFVAPPQAVAEAQVIEATGREMGLPPNVAQALARRAVAMAARPPADRQASLALQNLETGGH